MKIGNSHLSYCTNIHPGETWAEVFAALKTHLPGVKAAVSPEDPFGIGLRLSDLASRGLLEGSTMTDFKEWMEVEGLYVFTINGFPYGGFHGTRVKDAVHQPDWTTSDRMEYTLRLFAILAELLPSGMSGSISTSPISYKYWHSAEERKAVAAKGARFMVAVAGALREIEERTGKLLQLAIEPEPDGLLENTDELLDFFANYLEPEGMGKWGEEEGRRMVRRHIGLCYDVCHYALAYEDPVEAWTRLKAAGISIPKAQISAALRSPLTSDPRQRQTVGNALQAYNESTYLHQVVERDQHGNLHHYPDLPDALATIGEGGNREWRIHFHVPIFSDRFGVLGSTQSDIINFLELHQLENLTTHLEVETYTWEVLPEEHRLDLGASIVRELEWVKGYLRD